MKGLLEGSSGKNGILTVVFASLFLVSIGVISHDAFADTVVATIPVGGTDAAANPATNTVYVADSSKLIVVNGSVNKIAGTIQTPSYHVAVNQVTNKIYTTDFNVYNPCSVCFSVIDGNTNKVVTTMKIGQYPFDVTVNPDTDEVYVADQLGTVYVINGTDNSLVATIPIGGSVFGIEANPVTDKIYVQCDCPSNTLVVINGSENKIVANVPLSTNLPGHDVAVNPGTNTVYVTGRYTVSVINGTTNAVTASVSPCNTLFDVNVNPSTNKVYISCINFGNVAVIDGATNNVIQQIPVGSDPEGIGVNPSTNTVYVASSNTVSVIGYISPDTRTAPSAPVNLTATAESSSAILLMWSGPSSDGGSPITGYMIQRSTDGGTTWSTIASNTGSTAVKYNDTGLSPSTTYTYQVSAINSVGTSPSSNTASATTSGNTIASGIVLNNVQSTSGTTDSLNQITLSNFNTTAGADRLLVVGVSANSNNVGSITFAGVPLAREVSHFTNNDAELWYLTNPTGTGDITVTMNGPTQAVVGAYSFSGVNQTVPIPTHITRHNLTPGSPAISITTSHANDWVLDLPSIWGGVTLGSPTCTQQWNVNVPGQITGASSSTMVPSPATVTCSWTASSDDMWDDAAIEIGAAG